MLAKSWFSIPLVFCIQSDLINLAKHLNGTVPTVQILCIGTDKKVKVSHSLIAVGAVGVRVPLYLGHS